MVLFNSLLHGYPVAVPTDPERLIRTDEIIGGMCLTLDEWKAREKYILDLENYGL